MRRLYYVIKYDAIPRMYPIAHYRLITAGLLIFNKSPSAMEGDYAIKVFIVKYFNMLIFVCYGQVTPPTDTYFTPPPVGL